MSVVIETTLGDLTVDLFTEERPQTCKNFLKLCKLKYYNFSLFHTVQANFIAQAGDPTGTGSGGESVYGIVQGPESKYYEAESMPKIKHTKPGLLSMVNCGNNMLGSQFFVTLGSELQSLDEHCVFGEVTEGQDVLLKLNEAVCDFQNRPYRDIRITHTVVLDDPYDDIPGMQIPPASPDISQMPASNGRLGADEEVGEELTGVELEEANAEQEARARATILEIVGDIPHADIAPPENVLFVCKLNPHTNDDDLELIFSRFGKIKSCEVIRDHITGDSLQYAFIEFADKKSCEQAYMKMDNVLIDDRRIHVDFSQSVSKIRWKGKGRGVELIEKPEDNQPKPLMDLRYSSATMMSRGREQQQYYRDRDRRGRDDRRRDEGGRGRRRDEERREDRRRDDDRRRRGDRHETRRQPDSSSSSRRHREYSDHRRGEDHSSDRPHRRHEDISSQESMNHRSGRNEDRPREPPPDFKHIKPLMEKNIVKPTQDNGDFTKGVPYKITDVSPTKHKISPQQKEEKAGKIHEDDTNDNDIPRNDLSQSIVHSDVGSGKNSIDKKKKKIIKKKGKKKRRSSSTSSVSSDSSISSSSSSTSSSSSSTSSSSRERRLKKNTKSKRHRHSGVLTKKYYNRKGKLIKVVKKHRKASSSSSESSSDTSDIDRRRLKKKHRKKKKKKGIKKFGSNKYKKSSDEDEDDESDDSLSDISKNSDKYPKKRKHEDGKGSKSKKDLERISDNSQNEEEGPVQDKKKVKSLSVPLKKS